jgi:hypothetical protein
MLAGIGLDTAPIGVADIKIARSEFSEVNGEFGLFQSGQHPRGNVPPVLLQDGRKLRPVASACVQKAKDKWFGGSKAHRFQKHARFFKPLGAWFILPAQIGGGGIA